MVQSRLVLVFIAATLACVLLSACGAAPETGGGDGSEPPGSTGGSRRLPGARYPTMERQ